MEGGFRVKSEYVWVKANHFPSQSFFLIDEGTALKAFFSWKGDFKIEHFLKEVHSPVTDFPERLKRQTDRFD